MPSMNAKLGLVAAAGAVAIGSGIVAMTGLAGASTDEALPHDPAALRVEMVDEVGQQFASFGSPKFVPLAPDLTVIGSAKTAVTADSAYLLYGTDDHSVKVFVGSANSELRSASVDEMCAGAVTQYAVACSADEVATGGTLVTTVYAFSAGAEPNAPRTMVTPDGIASVPLESLEIERNVRYFGADGSMTSVTEALRAPTSTDALNQFTVSVADLREVATDPDLSWR